MTQDWPISLAAGVAKEHGPIRMIEAAAAARFDAVGQWFEPDDWTAVTTRAAAARSRDEGVPILDLEVFRFRPGPLDETMLRGADVAMEIGAQNLVVIGYDPDHAATAAKLHQLCAHVGDRLHVALEFIAFTQVSTLAQAVGIVAAADHPSATLLLDPLHLARTGSAPIDIAGIDPALIRYAQLCDVGPLGHDPEDLAAALEEAKEQRLLCGTGTLPLHDFIAALPRPMPLSIELMSRSLRKAHPDPIARAKALATSTRDYLRHIGTIPAAT